MRRGDDREAAKRQVARVRQPGARTDVQSRVETGISPLVGEGGVALHRHPEGVSGPGEVRPRPGPDLPITAPADSSLGTDTPGREIEEGHPFTVKRRGTVAGGRVTIGRRRPADLRRGLPEGRTAGRENSEDARCPQQTRKMHWEYPPEPDMARVKDWRYLTSLPLVRQGIKILTTLPLFFDGSREEIPLFFVVLPQAITGRGGR